MTEQERDKLAGILLTLRAGVQSLRMFAVDYWHLHVTEAEHHTARQRANAQQEADLLRRQVLALEQALEPVHQLGYPGAKRGEP